MQLLICVTAASCQCCKLITESYSYHWLRAKPCIAFNNNLITMLQTAPNQTTLNETIRRAVLTIVSYYMHGFYQGHL